jgi:eukaryotic-like serine/threonine-protein kinase
MPFEEIAELFWIYCRGSHRPTSMNISPDLWQQINPLLTDALDMEEGARAAWLQSLDQTHPQLSPLLRKMLAAHDRAERWMELETVPKLAPRPPASSAFSAGTAIGPFALIRLLGRGGMGEVWLAKQTDGRIEREVALKLPTTYLHSDVWRERFRRERDILAKLTHPNIARLFDAGVSEDDASRGQPYLAMEYVEGKSLTEYATAQKSTIDARLKIFQQILAAVAHAHRHLVVHRDLKPANILVDQSGQVKLLDFGIAKLIDDGTAAIAAADLTQMGGRVMTLRYAAPEQVSDGAISTATDTYALGVILHELLTGLSPYRAVRAGAALKEAALLDDDTVMPSALAMTNDAATERKCASSKTLSRQIAGDLDAIILKAMRKNPLERYASVEKFSEDIQRHLEHRPVKAREGTWRYLAGRFIARRKLPIAAAAAVLLTLVVGVVMVEQQRRVAVAEKARAEKHFASVRKLANSFMFDVHGEIENLAGSLKARQILVGTSLQYLDSLASEAREDPKLALEVAVAYRKLAEIKGDGRGSHLGQAASALQNAQRAAALLDAVELRAPDNIDILREHRVLSLFLGRLTLEAGDANGVNETEKAASIAEKITRLPRAEIADRRNLGATLAEYGGILAVVNDDHVKAAMQLTRAVDILEILARENPKDVLTRASLAYAYERAATGAEISGTQVQLPRAIALFEKSIATTEAVIRDDAANLAHQQTLVKRYNNAARAMLKFSDRNGARGVAAKGSALAARLVALDPGNVGNATMQVSVLATASDIEFRSGQFEAAAQLARESIAANARLPAETRAGLITRESVVGAMRSLGYANCALAEKNSQSRAQRIKLLKETQSLLTQSRAFKQELVDRKIDAREASAAIEEIDAESKKCGALMAVLMRD